MFVATERVDGRKGIDGLSVLVRSQFAEDPLSGTMFVFFSRRADRVRVLYWDRDGYVLITKRLEKGTYRLPWRTEQRRVVIEAVGQADPGPILATLLSDTVAASAYRLDAIVTVVDAVNGIANKMIQVKSKEEAVEWAKRCPANDGDIIEVRQVHEMSEFPPDVQKAAEGFQKLQGADVRS